MQLCYYVDTDVKLLGKRGIAWSSSGRNTTDDITMNMILAQIKDAQNVSEGFLNTSRVK